MNLNPIDFNYIDGENIYPLQEYIDEELLNNFNITSNNIIISSNNNFNITSNLKKDIISGSININLLNIGNNYIFSSNDIIANNNTKSLILSNAFPFGEIKFKTYNNQLEKVKIDYIGKLKVYHNYNILQPTFIEGFYDVEDEIFGLKNDGIAIDIQLTGLEAGAVFLQTEINTLIEGTNNIEGRLNAINDTITNGISFEQVQQNLTSPIFQQLADNYAVAIVNLTNTANSIYLQALSEGLIYGTAFVIGSAIFSTIASGFDYKTASNSLYRNPNFTETQKDTIYTQYSSNNFSNISNYNFSMCNLNVFQGFINSNIISQQIINDLNTTNLKATSSFQYQGQELSTTLNNYLLKAGGTMNGRINFNYGSGIFGTPTAGGGGSGERINLNMNGITSSDYPPSIGVSTNSLWFSSPNNQNYEWFNNGNQLMSLSSAGQLILNNPITTVERRYPPKAYTSSTNENVITFLGQSGMLNGTITLNPIGISYGSGVYEIYSSSRYNASEYQKRDLFNYNETTNEVGGHWASGQYSQFGVYQGVAYIKPDYLGDFLIVKLPNPIILTRFRFYPRIGLSFRIPAEFRFYGSMNGVDFTEITQASQITPRLTTNDIINGYYEKTLATGFNTPYLYIGFCCNKLIGTSGFPDCVNFQEFVMFGKEALSSTASLAIGTSDASTYALNVNGSLNASTILENNQSIPTISQNTILNSTPNVQKKYMFTGTCSSSILMPDGFTYYSYSIDLRNYTQLKYAPNPNTPYRIFNIKIFFGSVYFGYLTNGNPNVLSYEVYMSNESQGGGGGIGSAGLNVCAVGYPENHILNTISPTQLSLVCGDFNFVSVLSRVNGTVFNAIILDLLN
jgi:hypothetical protein